MKWSQYAWEAAVPVFDKIVKHSFIRGILDGTLDQEKFMFYVEQDAIYLSEYRRVLMGIASKLDNTDFAEAFIQFSGETLMVEKELHSTFIKSFSMVEASPTCLFYTSYLLKHLSVSPLEVIVAAILPCFKIYKEVGDYILKHQNKDGNPYQEWIDTYSSEEFEKSVNIAVSICDQLAEKCTKEQQEKMLEAYLVGSKLEWMFWDSAWKLEKWLV